MNTSSIHSCSYCAMSKLCLPLGLDKNDLGQLEALIQNSMNFTVGQEIFRQGDTFQKIYAVKTGTFKSSRLDELGNEYIVGFHLQGELIGLDGIYPQSYTCTTVALDTGVLCEMDYESLTKLCSEIPALQRQLLRLLSRDIYDSNVSQADNAEKTAEQKLAAFLHNLSARYEIRGYSATEFILAMTRQDIANHLGMTPETISRLLKRFRQKSILSIENRTLSIKNIDQLSQIINCAAS